MICLCQIFLDDEIVKEFGVDFQPVFKERYPELLFMLSLVYQDGQQKRDKKQEIIGEQFPFDRFIPDLHSVFQPLHSSK
jgi:hypothetical protein